MVWWVLIGVPRPFRVSGGEGWREVKGRSCSGENVGVVKESGDWKQSGVNEIRPLDHTCVCVCVCCVCVPVDLHSWVYYCTNMYVYMHVDSVHQRARA